MSCNRKKETMPEDLLTENDLSTEENAARIVVVLRALTQEIDGVTEDALAILGGLALSMPRDMFEASWKEVADRAKSTQPKASTGTFAAYQREAARTMPKGDEALSVRDAIACTALGVAGEAGELVELSKKHLFHGKRDVRGAVLTEAGDVLWYLANHLAAYGLTLEDAARANVEKLRERYPEGFVQGGGIR
jgi:NTP pyrophosphatase (non-canonical NTP hydrolase)